ncbi:MAG: NAD(P)/FAD-dependent oxidoreductase [Parafilimonas sp.]
MKSTIIIGGGAAGLMAAYELSKRKNHVIILEAKNRLGGRIFTINDNNFSQPIEAGAEFIHGDLPVTLSLLKEAGIAYHAIAGKMFQLEAGKVHLQKNRDAHWNKLIKQMQQLETDMALDDFLNTFFKDDKYAELRESVKNFAGGFDLADASKASVKSLSREWNNEMEQQYRIDGGYIQIINYLETECRKNGCVIHTNCCVKKINWKKDEVNINTMCSRFFKSSKIIITVPVSVLQAKDDNENYIEFAPAIPQHNNAAKNIGFGIVIKILLEFSEAFWNQQSKNIGFILTSEEIPTWWTQLPADNSILTGWVGGEKAVVLKDKTDEEILEIAMQSLSNAFAINKEDLQLKLKASSVYNWYKEPDINGGYSYNTLQSVEAKKVLHEPVDDTIFFSGEALFDGTPVGTVEAALDSGKKAALKVLATVN